MAMQFSSLETSMSPKLLLVQDGQHFDLRDFIAKEPNLAREALINGLFDIPLEDSHLHLILAQESIRRAATVKRDTTPYRLGGVLRDCGSDAIGQDTVEARIYKAGGPKAVAVYAAALQDKTKGEREKTLGIMRVDVHVASLSTPDLISLANCIDRLELHPDLRYLLDRARRTKPREARVKRLPGSQRRRTTKHPSGAASASEYGQNGDKLSSGKEAVTPVTSEVPMLDPDSINNLCNLTIPHFQTMFPDPTDLGHFICPGTFASYLEPDAVDFTTDHGFSE